MRRFFGLTAVFFLCFVLDLFIPQSWLAMPFVGFSPFLTTLMGRSEAKTMLYMAFFCGVVHDLFSLQHRLGVAGLAYLFAVLINLVFKRRYYEERLIPFFGVTFFISLTYSLFFLIFGALKGLVIEINLKMINYHLIVYPFFDAIISLVGVFIPIKIYNLIKKTIYLRRHES